MNRHVLSIVVVILCAGCRHVEETSVPAVNLLREFEAADKRPSTGFEIADREVDGISHPSIVAPVPSRLTIPLPLPRHGVLRAFVSLEPVAGGAPAAPIHLRIGISDDRIYERLTDIVGRCAALGILVSRAGMSFEPLVPSDFGWVLATDGTPLRTPECLTFELAGDGRIRRVEVFTQSRAPVPHPSPGPGPGPGPGPEAER